MSDPLNDVPTLLFVKHTVSFHTHTSSQSTQTPRKNLLKPIILENVIITPYIRHSNTQKTHTKTKNVLQKNTSQDFLW